MKFSFSYTNPMTIWNRLAWRSGEMMLASAQVIAHRSQQMLMAGSNPSAKDQAEFALMGQEKVEAAQESLQAMALQSLDIGGGSATRTFGHMFDIATAGFALAASTTPTQIFARQVALGQAWTKLPSSLTSLSNDAARVAHRGLTPIHKRARANAKRLGSKG